MMEKGGKSSKEKDNLRRAPLVADEGVFFVFVDRFTKEGCPYSCIERMRLV